MTQPAQFLRSSLSRVWQGDRVLTFLGVVMLCALAASGIGLVLDTRMIAGAPAWLKPAKFAVSTAVYSLTLAWVFTWLPDWPLLRLRVAWTTAVVFGLEVAIIDLQAWRGTTSHFNVATPLDATLFAVMGTAIAVQTVASAFVAYALWRQRFTDRAMGAALRAGMVITLLGASSGGLMTRPTSEQVSELRQTKRMPAAGAHTVGAPDGGPGLPGTGWSREHGDLRIPHFVGLHALQVLPVIVVVLRHRRRAEGSLRVIRAAATSYAAIFGILLFQALRGEALLAPAPATAGLLAGWAVLTGASLWAAGRRWNVMTDRSAVAGA